MAERSGGDIIADVLARRGVRFLFTLCGGHISPILVSAKRRGVRIVDVRDEKNAVFAADATARMTGTTGVAAVTAGPGVTNTLTAIKNAQMAESPLVLFGGATPTMLKGRGALQDIEQLALMRPLTKGAASLKTLAELEPAVERAFQLAQSGVPGPVFLEIPVDLLYPEAIVREWYMKEVQGAKGLAGRAMRLYVRGHLYRQFHAPRLPLDLPTDLDIPRFGQERVIAEAAKKLREAKRPVLVIGSQALVNVRDTTPLVHAIERLGVPTYLGGMARGLLGRHHPLQLRHNRGKALKEADHVIIAGFPFDFRLGYGRSIARKATLVAANLSPTSLRKNRKPDLGVVMHAGTFLESLAAQAADVGVAYAPWFETLRAREQERDTEIATQAKTAPPEGQVNPLHFFLKLEEHLADDAVLVVDGGDFVATASYVLRPRGPLSWLDPGVFGTLGVGGGFAVGAALCSEGREVWLIYGDGSSAYSLSEMDTCVRHGLAPIAVIGNDGAWAQIAREQVEILGDDVGTVLRRADYHVVGEGYGAVGLLCTDPAKIDETLAAAKAHAKAGRPVVINLHIAATAFRKGSISM